jgi:hypothetical protein
VARALPPSCGEEVETVEHWLMNCKMRSDTRKRAFQMMQALRTTKQGECPTPLCMNSSLNAQDKHETVLAIEKVLIEEFVDKTKGMLW